jgi:hypothetical protein
MVQVVQESFANFFLSKQETTVHMHINDRKLILEQKLPITAQFLESAETITQSYVFLNFLNIILGCCFSYLGGHRVLGYVHICKGPNRVHYAGIFQPLGGVNYLFYNRRYQLHPFSVWCLIYANKTAVSPTAIQNRS